MSLTSFENVLKSLSYVNTYIHVYAHIHTYNFFKKFQTFGGFSKCFPLYNSWVRFNFTICRYNFIVGLSLWWLSGKESACNAGDVGLIPGWGRSPGQGSGNPLQYSCLGNPVDRGAWWATIHVAHQGSQKSWTWLSDWTTTTISLTPTSLTSFKIQTIQNSCFINYVLSVVGKHSQRWLSNYKKNAMMYCWTLNLVIKTLLTSLIFNIFI